jgi:3-hydroxymyristoyl/3-hydroxydecanoyl-(acyl carrier protein) dehydratase
MAATETSWRVPADHPSLAGHFPGHPIVPGVVLLDRVMQLAAQAHGGSIEGWQVAQAKFLSPCGPGDELVFALRDGARGGLAFSVRCGDREVASGSLVPPAP